MKKILSLFAVALLVVALSACTTEMEPTPAPPQSEEIVALDDCSYDEPFFSCTGTGDDVIQGLHTDDYSFLKVTHLGNGHFSVWGHHGDKSDLLINTTSPYNQGCTLLEKGQEYTLEIGSKGEWVAEAYRLGTSSSTSFYGSGDCITPIFVAETDIYEIEAEGDGHFAVWGHHEDGSRDLLVNTADTYSGKVMFRGATGKHTFFEITGERDWTILSDGDDAPVAVGSFEQQSKSEDNDYTEDTSNDTSKLESNDASYDSEQPQKDNSKGASLITQEQQDKIIQAENERKKNTFMLAIAQNDLETFFWGGTSIYESVWRQLYMDDNYNANWVWQDVKTDLDIYNAFDNSEYTDLWVMAEALYDAYESGALKEATTEEAYQQLIDDINKISNRLGVFYASKEIADSYS